MVCGVLCRTSVSYSGQLDVFDDRELSSDGVWAHNLLEGVCDEETIEERERKEEVYLMSLHTVL